MRTFGTVAMKSKTASGGGYQACDHHYSTMEPPAISTLPTLHCVDDTTDHTDLDKDQECHDSDPCSPVTSDDVTTRLRNCLLIAFNIDFLFTTLSSDYLRTRVAIDFLVVDLTPSTLIINISTIASVGSLCVYFPSSQLSIHSKLR